MTHERFLQEFRHYIKDLKLEDRQIMLEQAQARLHSEMNLYPKVLADELRKAAGYKGLIQRNSYTKVLLIIISCLIILITLFLLWLSPFPLYSESENKMRLLGENIVIDKQITRVKFFNFYFFGDPPELPFKSVGAIDELDDLDILQLEVDSAYIEILPGDQLKWDCMLPQDDPVQTQVRDRILRIDFKSAQYVNCRLEIPFEVNVELKGTSAKIKIASVESEVFAELEYGDIEVSSNEHKIIESLNSKQRTYGIGALVKLELENGQVFDTSSL